MNLVGRNRSGLAAAAMIREHIPGDRMRRMKIRANSTKWNRPNRRSPVDLTRRENKALLLRYRAGGISGDVIASLANEEDSMDLARRRGSVRVIGKQGLRVNQLVSPRWCKGVRVSFSSFEKTLPENGNGVYRTGIALGFRALIYSLLLVIICVPASAAIGYASGPYSSVVFGGSYVKVAFHGSYGSSDSLLRFLTWAYTINNGLAGVSGIAIFAIAFVAFRGRDGRRSAIVAAIISLAAVVGTLVCFTVFASLNSKG